MKQGQIVTTVACLMFAWACGCSSAGPRYPERIPEDRLPAEEILWPAAPYPPKIAYVTAFNGTADLGVSRSFFDLLGRIAGISSDEAFVRPTAIATAGSLLAVADPGKAALFLVDRQARRYKKITEGDAGELVSPVGVAIGNEGTVYLTDSALGRVYLYGRDGRLRDTWGQGELARPSGVAIDETLRRLYVVDAARHHVVVYDLEGRILFTFGTHGLGEGEFNWPSHVYVDPGELVHVVDSLNFRVQVFKSDGTFVSTFGRAGNVSGDIARPKGIARDSNGNLYVVDALFDSVQIFDVTGELLLSFGKRGVGPGEFWLPTGLAIARDDTIYVADSHNHRIQVFRFLAGN